MLHQRRRVGGKALLPGLAAHRLVHGLRRQEGAKHDAVGDLGDQDGERAAVAVVQPSRPTSAAVLQSPISASHSAITSRSRAIINS
jgi:hypothetical protein